MVDANQCPLWLLVKNQAPVNCAFYCIHRTTIGSALCTSTRDALLKEKAAYAITAHDQFGGGTEENQLFDVKRFPLDFQDKNPALFLQKQSQQNCFSTMGRPTYHFSLT